MKDCRINGQNYIIEAILLALKSCSMGLGMSEKYSIERIGNEYSSTLIFTPNEGFEINAADFYWLGHHVGEEYI